MGKIEKILNNKQSKDDDATKEVVSNQFRWGLSKEVHTEDALALGAEEGRSKLR